jgi:ribosome maturation factor RimP
MDQKTLEKIIEDCGVNLYDTESVIENEQKIYRIYITHKDGVSLDKCAEVTRIISPILDLDPPMSGQYALEVSSPGIERKLSTLSHFQQSIGENVKVKLLGEDENIKIQGKLMKVEGEQITVYEKEKQKDTTFSFAQVLKAKTYFQW